MQNPQTRMFRLLGICGIAGLLKQCKMTQAIVDLPFSVYCEFCTTTMHCQASKPFQKQDACLIACLMVCALEAPTQHTHESKPRKLLVAHSPVDCVGVQHPSATRAYNPPWPGAARWRQAPWPTAPDRWAFAETCPTSQAAVLPGPCYVCC